MREVHFKSVCELTRAIKNKSLTSVQLLESYRERIERLNPELNAVVTRDFESSLKKARQADKALAKDDIKGPLHGIPITIKDNLEVAGLPCTAGAPEFENYRPTKSADLVKSLLRAGAIIMGKTNLSRFAEDLQSYNSLFGQTNNPWDFSRTPGGSSGGAVAAIAAGLTSFDMGNDLGGSIRIPAHFCGVYGHKPSYGIVPEKGMIPPQPGVYTRDYILNTDIAVNGPLARAPEDLELLLDLIIRPEKPERKAWSIKLPPARHKKLKSFRVGVWLDDPACPVAETIINRIRRVADALANAGTLVEEKHPKLNFDRNFKLFSALLGGIRGHSTPSQIFNKWLEQDAEEKEKPDCFQNWQISGAVQRHREWLCLDAGRQIIRQKWSQYFKQFDVMLCPVAPVTAFPHDHSPWFSRKIMVNDTPYPYSNLMGWTGLIGLAYLPSTTAPIGISSKGLPIGVQIVGPYLEDRTTIQFAKLLKELVGGFTPPPPCI